MKKPNAWETLCVTAVALGAATAFGDTTSPVLVDTSPGLTRRWMTVYTNEIPLAWNWQAGASSVSLSVVGLDGAVSTNFSGVASNMLWRVFSSRVPSSEDVYNLALTFYTNGTTAVGTLTSRLAVVAGAFGAVSIDTGPESRTWRKVTGNVLIPYDADWTNSTTNAVTSRLVIAKPEGATQTNALSDASGYFGWKLEHSDWGYGTFNLSLTFPGTEGEWDAMLTRLLGGTMIRVQ
jgi:hypothetical protein